MRRGLAVLFVLAALPAAAHAQPPGNASITLQPPQAGKPSKLILRASGDAVSSGQQAPRSLALSIFRGFRLDTRSRAARCRPQQVSAFACPPASRVGRGHAVGQATVPPLGTFTFTVDIEAFLVPRVQSSDVAGVVALARERRSGRRGTVNGRLLRVNDGAFGYELRFENLDFAGRTAPPGASARLTSFELRVSARRRVRKVKRVKRRVKTRRGTRIRRRRRVRVRRYYLIRNPRTCAGSWPFRVRATFPSGPEVVRDGSVACSG